MRTATKEKIPVVCVVGRNEVEAGSLSVRLYQGGQDLGQMPKEDVIARLLKANADKAAFQV